MQATTTKCINAIRESLQPNEIKEKLDPISILAKCALLSFKSEGSRLTYSNDFEIIIQDPAEYNYICNYVLPAVRAVKGQSHKDIDIIGTAIEKVAAWHQPHLKESVQYKTLLESASFGIESLIKTYRLAVDYGVVVNALEKYKTRITEVTQKEVQQNEDLDEQSKRLKALWTSTEITLINERMNELKNHQKNTTGELEKYRRDKIASLENLINEKKEDLAIIWSDYEKNKAVPK